MTPPLTAEQQIFNQRLLAEHCMSEYRAHSVWKSLNHNNHNSRNKNDSDDVNDLKESIAVVNRSLLKVGLEIRGLSVKGQRYYAFVNNFPDEVAQKVFAMAPTEQAYVRTVFRQLIGTDVNGNECTKAALLNARDKSLSLPACEVILDRLIDEKWIDWVDARKRNANASKLTLAPRTFLELSYMLVDDFGMNEESLPQVMYYRT